MLQDERRPRDDETARADGKGHQISHEHTQGGRDRGYAPDREELPLFAGTLVENHVHAEGDPR